MFNICYNYRVSLENRLNKEKADDAHSFFSQKGFLEMSYNAFSKTCLIKGNTAQSPPNGFARNLLVYFAQTLCGID